MNDISFPYYQQLAREFVVDWNLQTIREGSSVIYEFEFPSFVLAILNVRVERQRQLHFARSEVFLDPRKVQVKVVSVDGSRIEDVRDIESYLLHEFRYRMELLEIANLRFVEFFQYCQRFFERFFVAEQRGSSVDSRHVLR